MWCWKWSRTLCALPWAPLKSDLKSHFDISYKESLAYCSRQWKRYLRKNTWHVNAFGDKIWEIGNKQTGKWLQNLLVVWIPKLQNIGWKQAKNRGLYSRHTKSMCYCSLSDFCPQLYKFDTKHYKTVRQSLTASTVRTLVLVDAIWNRRSYCEKVILSTALRLQLHTEIVSLITQFFSSYTI